MSSKPGVILTGAGGQLGLTISTLWHASEIARHFGLHPFTHAELDCADSAAVDSAFGICNCRAVINTASYTKVDAAEEDIEQAYAANEAAPGVLAKWCAANRVRLIHVSTDFVFQGDKTLPYNESDQPGPISVYGKSKLAGEMKISAVDGLESAIVRTSWLYSRYGNNFVRTILRLLNEKDRLAVVNDQIGSPTSTDSLARLIFALVEAKSLSHSLYHWSDGAEISWYDFAVAIQELGSQRGLCKTGTPILPIPASEYPTPAKRPAFSVLDRSRALADLGVKPSKWKEELAFVLDGLAEQAGK